MRTSVWIRPGRNGPGFLWMARPCLTHLLEDRIASTAVEGVLGEGKGPADEVQECFGKSQMGCADRYQPSQYTPPVMRRGFQEVSCEDPAHAVADEGYPVGLRHGRDVPIRRTAEPPGKDRPLQQLSVVPDGQPPVVGETRTSAPAARRARRKLAYGWKVSRPRRSLTSTSISEGASTLPGTSIPLPTFIRHPHASGSKSQWRLPTSPHKVSGRLSHG